MQNPDARKPFKKQLAALPMEAAHGGSGKRQVILSKHDAVSAHMEAMTKGILEPRACFDWHEHDAIDEFFYVTQGTGIIEFEDGNSFTYQASELVYVPANVKHKITCTGTDDSHFLFVRLRA